MSKSKIFQGDDSTTCAGLDGIGKATTEFAFGFVNRLRSHELTDLGHQQSVGTKVLKALGQHQLGLFRTSPGHVPVRFTAHQRDWVDHSLDQGWVDGEQLVQVLVQQSILTLQLLVRKEGKMILDCLKGVLDLAKRLAGLVQKLLESNFTFQVDLLSLADQTSLDENDHCQLDRIRLTLCAKTGNEVLFGILEFVFSNKYYEMGIKTKYLSRC